MQEKETELVKWKLALFQSTPNFSLNLNSLSFFKRNPQNKNKQTKLNKILLNTCFEAINFEDRCKYSILDHCTSLALPTLCLYAIQICQ
jgi:hypothetical protein